MARRAEATHTSRHCVTNMRLHEDGPSAVGVAYIVTAHRRAQGETHPTVTVADFTDVWVQVDGTWLLRSRSIAPAFPPPQA